MSLELGLGKPNGRAALGTLELPLQGQACEAAGLLLGIC